MDLTTFEGQVRLKSKNWKDIDKDNDAVWNLNPDDRKYFCEDNTDYRIGTSLEDSFGV